MGSFRSVCNISGQPIREGDAVRLFLLETKDLHRIIPVTTMCYSNQIASPIALPLRGVATDYGNIVDEDKPLVDSFNARVLENFVAAHHAQGVFKLAENEYRPQDMKDEARIEASKDAGIVLGKRADWNPEMTHIQNALLAAQGGEMWIGDGGLFNSRDQWCYALGLESMYQALPLAYFGEERLAELKGIATADLQAWFRFLKKHWPDVRKLARSADPAEKDRWGNLWSATEGMGLMIDRYDEFKGEMSGDDFARSHYHNDRYMDVYSVRRLYADQVKAQCEEGVDPALAWTEDSPSWLELRGDLVDFMMFGLAFDDMGMTYVPLRTGGQGEEFEERRRWAKVIADHVDADHQRYVDRYGE